MFEIIERVHIGNGKKCFGEWKILTFNEFMEIFETFTSDFQDLIATNLIEKGFLICDSAIFRAYLDEDIMALMKWWTFERGYSIF